MQVDVILRKKSGRYQAQVREWPEVVAEEETRQEAIEKVSENLMDYLSQQIEIVRIDVPIVNGQDNPWITQFARFKDDPTFADFQKEIAAYRQEIDS